MVDDRLPTALWIDAHIRALNAQAIPCYVVNKGAYASGMVLLKIDKLDGTCVLVNQQRDLEGRLGWMNALDKDLVALAEADSYIERALKRDPDLWVIEIESREGHNPFEGRKIG